MIARTLLMMLLTTNAKGHNIVQCESDGPFYFKFLPKRIGTLKLNQISKIKALCFQNVEFSLMETDESFEVLLMAREKKDWLCSDIFMITNVKNSSLHIPFISGSYRTNWSKATMSEAEILYTRNNGLTLLMSCAELKDWPRSIWMSLKTFIGGLGINPYIPIFGSKNPEYQIEANREWVKGWSGYEHPRRTDVNILVDKKSIKSGTFVCIYRFDGLDNLVNIITGSRIGHTGITLWDDGDLYIFESQDSWY